MPRELWVPVRSKDVLLRQQDRQGNAIKAALIAGPSAPRETLELIFLEKAITALSLPSVCCCKEEVEIWKWWFLARLKFCTLAQCTQCGVL